MKKKFVTDYSQQLFPISSHLDYIPICSSCFLHLIFIYHFSLSFKSSRNHQRPGFSHLSIQINSQWKQKHALSYYKISAFNRLIQFDLLPTGQHANCATYRRRQIVNICTFLISNCSTLYIKILFHILVHLLDIWNVIEAFRENGLNTLEPTNEVSVARLETLISSLYHNLNKRLPTNQQVAVDSKAGLLLNWLLSAYTNNNSGIRVFSIKVALAIMCAGKLVDKLRCKFSSEMHS